MARTVTSRPTTSPRTVSRLYSVLIGLAALGIVLQGVWAGLFIRTGATEYNETWVEVHARGADITIVLAVLALGAAIWRLRSRRDLLVGTAALAVLLLVEAFVGGLIEDSQLLEVIHFPLALALLGLAVWLPLRSRR
ncbi:MAG: hypothetical protein J2P14_17500 [Acidothermales bacterium]|nr:hypothetical protein [Acidothermales bacterium]